MSMLPTLSAIQHFIDAVLRGIRVVQFRDAGYACDDKGITWVVPT